MTITLVYTNRQLDEIKLAIRDNFKAAWNGVAWVLTKVVRAKRWWHL